MGIVYEIMDDERMINIYKNCLQLLLNKLNETNKT